jgi:plasmid stability protein
MSIITIRRLPPEVHRALKAQATAEGISAEEKARRVLSAGLLPESRTGFGSDLMACIRDLGLEGADVEYPRLTGDIEPADLGTGEVEA